ncbi:MAG: hypothetical protein IPO85_12270, partial [Saprospiraceae bacterium]|nr:hypothetical protein [Candidatus Defluviibacterium haderslevense]
ELTQLVLTLVNLIRILENDGYIILVQTADRVSSQSQFGNCVINETKIYKEFPDKNVIKLLLEYVEKEIVITEEFRRFCNKGFIARDEQRYKKQFIISTSALVVAICALCINTCINVRKRIIVSIQIK